MSRFSIFAAIAGLAVIAAPGSVGAQGTDGLFAVSDIEATHPDLATYARRMGDVLHEEGRICGSVTRINAYPDGAGLRTVVVCSTGGKRYEILSQGSDFDISEQP